MAINQVILLIHTQHVHVGLASDPIQMESSTGEATAVECDIGKLLHLGKDLHSLHRDDKYRILKREPNPHPSAYPRTRQYSSGPFQPSWVVQYPWLHYSAFCDGVLPSMCLVCSRKSWRLRSWASKSQKMSNHGSLEYHLVACTKMQAFLAMYEQPS